MEQKNKSSRIVVFCLCAGLLATSCEKYPFDYRNKYVGSWDFVIQESTWDGDGLITDTTYQCEGSVYYHNKKKDLFIEYCEGTFVVMSVTKKGDLSEGQLKGEITESELHISSSHAGLGGGASFTIEGVKK